MGRAVKPLPYQRQNKALVALIDGFISAENMNRNDFAVKVQMAPATLNRRMREPWKFTLEELRHIFQYVGERAEEIRIF